jgi:hypothetical protein
MPSWIVVDAQVVSADGAREWTRQILVNVEDIVTLEDGPEPSLGLRGCTVPIVLKQPFASVMTLLRHSGVVHGG